MRKIGITTHVEHNRSHQENTINMDYIRAVMSAGGLPILVPVTLDFGMLDDYLNLIDGLILTGGCDINPGRYGEINQGLSVDISDERDHMELYLLRGAIQRKMPVLGICRGMQLINIHLEGTLYQDMMAQHHTEIDHVNLENEIDYLSHSVKLNPQSVLAQWLSVDRFRVNSRHHQAIKRLGNGLIAVGFARDGIIEAIEHPDLNLYGVQWHPEDLVSTQKLQHKLFVSFIDDCQKIRRL